MALCALAILVSLFQNAGGDSPVALVGIEEPETGLHSGAAAVLLDALQEASQSVQVVITTHSTDLLDNKEVPSDAIRAVGWQSGHTRIQPLDPATRSVLHDRLYTAGELMRMGGLHSETGEHRGTTDNEVAPPIK